MSVPDSAIDSRDKSGFRKFRQHPSDRDSSPNTKARQTPPSRVPPVTISVRPASMQRSYSGEPRIQITHVGSSRSQFPGQQLTPIPGSDASSPPSPSHNAVPPLLDNGNDRPSPRGIDGPSKNVRSGNMNNSDSLSRSKSSSYISHRPQQPQSLNAALEKITTSHSDSGHGSSPRSPASASSLNTRSSSQYERSALSIDPATSASAKPLPSPRPIPAFPTTNGRSISGPTVGGKGISAPIPNHAATLQMSPVKNRANGQPIPVQPRIPLLSNSAPPLDSGSYPILPVELATDIQQFSESDFAQQYFATHRTGFIFRRKVPVTQLMTWQKDAVKIFKVIQYIMGDRERERGPGVRLPPENGSTTKLTSASATSLSSNTGHILEEERWLLGEGLTHGELRDEIYCQLMKQLNGNPSTQVSSLRVILSLIISYRESIFRGWQLLCVLLITFPPSKNFENYLSAFFLQHSAQREGRVDIMAKYCSRRLAYISMKGPRGKPPSTVEIETASDAAFHPSTFGEPLDAIIRLQERKYPQQKVPIILPFLADGILALGGLKAEGIFRVPGDGDSVSELKLRIDRGYYTTDGVNDPHVLASLMKLWLRELCDPLVPEEMYNECITSSKDPDACIQIVERLPTINRRVVLFVVSFLQLFLEEKAQSITKMTPANLALVMAPNLLRCNSDSMSVVFTNAQ
ncbi:hypothetical protein H0H81_010032 [Sphagnurus paluster]|uniref:Rho-GAP domain-containing protein n=1 Tax=Sphagnurus paluster TaxID=117069 RepID=A0A9P7K6G4_9AGAR|nr:hypothetical protein H0H81_010032 [Sphagnurus paluster]